MTVFTLTGRFGIYPGAEKCAFLAGAEIKGDPDYGKIYRPTWGEIKKALTESKGKKGDAPAPPAPHKMGGGYPTYDAAWKSYSSLWEEAVGKGYKIFEIPAAEMKRYGEVDGFEADDWILIQNDMPIGRKYEVLAHEYAAKLLREEHGKDFDHERDHHKVYKRGEELEDEFLKAA
jgi:hypothetical protein